MVIRSPEDGESFTGHQQISLSCSAFDAVDGALEGANLRWHSNAAGELGTGASLGLDAFQLAEGAHTVSVVASNSVGLLATNSVVIRVVHEAPPFLRIDREDGGFALSWPGIAFRYSLQAGPRLPVDGAWSAVQVARTLARL